MFKTASSTKHVLAYAVTLFSVAFIVNVPNPIIIGTAEQMAQHTTHKHVALANKFDILGFNGKQMERNLSTAMAAKMNDEVLFMAAVWNRDNLHNHGTSKDQKFVMSTISMGKLTKQFIRSLNANVIIK